VILMTDVFPYNFHLMWKAEEYVLRFHPQYAGYRTILVCAAGFEKRSTALIRRIEHLLTTDTLCLVIVIRNPLDSDDANNNAFQEQNFSKISETANRRGAAVKRIQCQLFDEKRVVVGQEQLAASFTKILADEDLSKSRFILDISCLPRVLMFSMINYFYDFYPDNELLVGITENESEKSEWNRDYPYTEASWVSPFLGTFSDSPNDINIWIPILGRDRKRVNVVLSKYRFGTIFPLIGFPSSTPQDTDLVAKEHKELFMDYGISSKDVLYSPTSDPFLLFLRVKRLVDYLTSLPGLSARTFISISPFGTKAQSLGAFLCGRFLRMGILYTQPIGYKPVIGDEGDSFIYYLRGQMYSVS